jgi:hypothetical protein
MSTKNKTGTNSNEDDVEEKKSCSLGDLSNEDFPERGTGTIKYSIIGNKNIETIIEEQNDGEIGEDSIH